MFKHLIRGYTDSDLEDRTYATIAAKRLKNKIPDYRMSDEFATINGLISDFEEMSKIEQTIYDIGFHLHKVIFSEFAFSRYNNQSIVQDMTLFELIIEGQQIYDNFYTGFRNEFRTLPSSAVSHTDHPPKPEHP